MGLALALMLLAADDDPWAEPPPRPVLAPAHVQERLVVLQHRETAKRTLNWVAGGVATVGALVLVDWLLVNTAHFELGEVFQPSAGPPNLSPQTLNTWLAFSLSSLALAGVMAVIGGLVGWGVDSERFELTRG